jgi:hypothetical protein
MVLTMPKVNGKSTSLGKLGKPLPKAATEPLKCPTNASKGLGHQSSLNAKQRGTGQAKGLKRPISKATCIACGGTGTNSKGGECVPCRGRGTKDTSMAPVIKEYR